jgi:ribosomal protein S16
MLEKEIIKIDLDKYNEWIQRGAKPSQTVRSLIKKVNSNI